MSDQATNDVFTDIYNIIYIYIQEENCGCMYQ